MRGDHKAQFKKRYKRIWKKIRASDAKGHKRATGGKK